MMNFWFGFFIIIPYIFYKNYFILKLEPIKILKKYKVLLLILFSLPFLFNLIEQIKININIDFLIIFTLWLILLIILYWIVALSGFIKWLSVYDTSIYMYILLYIICIILNNNRSEKIFLPFVIFNIIISISIIIQSATEFAIVIYQQLIKRFVSNNNKK